MTRPRSRTRAPFLALTLAAACGGRTSAPATLTILQFNDVYEITAMAGGAWGGPARVASLHKALLERNPNTLLLLAGDFLSPSALSTSRVDGERLDGRQMVAVLNALGVDYATFGNHEFDLREAPFMARLGEAEFPILSVNVTAAGGAPLPDVRRHVILRYPDGAGGEVRVAIFGVTIDRDQAPYAPIAPPVPPAIEEAHVLADSADIIIAMTHMSIGEDIQLADAAPGIDLILGGHEHENILVRRGADLTPITKADANFRTVYIHDLRWDPVGRRVNVTSRLVAINDSLPDDPATAAVAARWVRAGYDGFRENGFQPESTVARIPVEFDGREAVVYRESTELTRAIADAMLADVPDADAAVYNAGSIRLDDVLPPGPVTQYDVIRVLPFGGPTVEVRMTGALLRRVLDQGWRNRGTGGFLQLARIERADAGWTIAGAALDDARTYRIAVPDFLISGREQNLDFLNRENPGLTVLRSLRDVRFALIDHLRARYGR
jgi:5'-nucleotidase